MKNNHVRDIKLLLNKRKLEYDFPVFCKYNQYYRFLKKFYEDSGWENDIPTTNFKEIIIYDIYDRKIKQEVTIFDYDGMTSTELFKLNTLFVIISSDRYDEFINKISLLDLDHPLRKGWEDDKNHRTEYEQEILDILINIDRLSSFQKNCYEDLEIIINSRSLESATSGSQRKSIDIGQRVVLNGDDFVKTIVDDAKKNLLKVIENYSNDITEQGLSRLRKRLGEKLPYKHDSQSQYTKPFVFYLYRLISSYVDNEKLTINNSKLSEGEKLTLACDILSRLHYIPVKHLNKVDHWQSSKDYIRKGGKIYLGDKRSQYWDIQSIFDIILPYAVPIPVT